MKTTTTTKEPDPAQVAELIAAVAALLTSTAAEMSIRLAQKNPAAIAWARAYTAAGCRGWVSADEAEAAIRRTLGL